MTIFKKKKKVEEEVIAPVVEETVEEVVAPVEEVTPVAEIPAGISYNGVAVLEKLEIVNGDGRLCLMSNGTTTYVPLSVLGESENE